MKGGEYGDGIAVWRAAGACAGRSGLRVSALGLGGAGLGGAYGEITDDEAIGAVQAALAGGITYFDTSPSYRQSERRLGLALDGIDRQRIVLSTKTGTHPQWRGDYSAEATYRTVENSLRLLRTDVVDLLLVHDSSRSAQALGPAGAVDALEDLKRQGVIKAIGLGVHSDGLHRQAILSGRIDVVMTYLEYTLVSTAAAGTIFPLAAQHQVGVVNASPLAMGLLSGMDPDIYLRDVMQWTDEKHLARPRAGAPSVALGEGPRHPACGACAAVQHARAAYRHHYCGSKDRCRGHAGHRGGHDGYCRRDLAELYEMVGLPR